MYCQLWQLIFYFTKKQARYKFTLLLEWLEQDTLSLVSNSENMYQQKYFPKEQEQNVLGG